MIDPYPEVTYLTASAQVTLAGFGGSSGQDNCSIGCALAVYYRQVFALGSQ